MLAEERQQLTEQAASAQPENAKEYNFLIQVNQLVAEIMQLLSKLSDRDRKKTDHMKKEYDAFNNRVSGAIKEKGAVQFGGAGITLGIMIVGAALCGYGTISANSFSAISQIGGQVPGLSSIWTAGLDAEASKYGNKINLINTDLQNTASKSSDNSGWKNELIQALNDVKEWLRASTRSNG
jgi:hypothetical protein